MERARTHLIDSVAAAVFTSAIPTGWVARPESPDYGIDYIVQVFDPKSFADSDDRFAATIPSGERFAVQLKGTEYPKGDDQFVKFRLETNSLQYYVDVERLPVILVVVDVRRQEAFWLFVQEYADDWLADSGWRSQETTTVSIPRVNRFVCNEAFRQEVRRAIGYMLLRNRQDVGFAILADQRRLEKIDSRFDVKVGFDADGMKRTFSLKPSASMSGSINLSGDVKRRENFALGKTVPFLPGEVELDSPLFASHREASGYVRVGASAEAIVIVTAADDPSVQLILAGEMTRGIGGGCFEARPGSIQFKYQFRLEDDDVNATVKASFWLDMSHWHGKPILSLERFEEIDRFFGVRKRSTARMQWIVDGAPGTPAVVQLSTLSDDWSDVLVGVRKAQEIARRVGVSPIFPKEFGESHKRTIDKIYALVFEGEYRIAAPNAYFTTTTSSSESKALNLHVARNISTIAMNGSFPEEENFLDHPIDLVMTEVALTHAKPRRPEVAKDGTVLHRFSGTRRSEMIYRSTKEFLSAEESDRRFGRVPPRFSSPLALASTHLDANRDSIRLNISRSRSSDDPPPLAAVSMIEEKVHSAGDMGRDARQRARHAMGRLKGSKAEEILVDVLGEDYGDYMCDTDPIGRGGYAFVYRAIDQRTAEAFALKRPIDLDDEESCARMKREIEEQRRIVSRHVMPLVEHAEDFRWFTMPLAVGNLEDLRPGLDDVEIVRILDEAAQGLEAAHDLGLVHRDVTPRNIMALDADGERRWVVADWGLVRRPRGATTVARTKANSFFGTEGFAAPESWDDAHELTAAADVYGLGRVAAWAVTGQWPKPNLALETDGPWRRLVRQSTLMNLRDRLQTMSEFRALLKDVLRANTALVSQSWSERAEELVPAVAKGDLAAVREVVDLALEHPNDVDVHLDVIARTPPTALRQLVNDRPGDVQALVEGMSKAFSSWRNRSFDYANTVVGWFEDVAQAAVVAKNHGLLEDAAYELFCADANSQRYPQRKSTRHWLHRLNEAMAVTVARSLARCPDAIKWYTAEGWDWKSTPRAIRAAIAAVVTASGDL